MTNKIKGTSIQRPLQSQWLEIIPKYTKIVYKIVYKKRLHKLSTKIDYTNRINKLCQILPRNCLKITLGS